MTRFSPWEDLFAVVLNIHHGRCVARFKTPAIGGSMRACLLVGTSTGSWTKRELPLASSLSQLSAAHHAVPLRRASARRELSILPRFLSHLPFPSAPPPIRSFPSLSSPFALSPLLYRCRYRSKEVEVWKSLDELGYLDFISSLSLSLFLVKINNDDHNDSNDNNGKEKKQAITAESCVALFIVNSILVKPGRKRKGGPLEKSFSSTVYSHAPRLGQNGILSLSLSLLDFRNRLPV